MDTTGADRQPEKAWRGTADSGVVPGAEHLSCSMGVGEQNISGKEPKLNPEIREKRVKKYGSFLFCPMRSTLCFGRDTDLECIHESCILDDPGYIKLQERISENRKNAERKMKLKALDQEIEEKENYAKRCYRNNEPRKGDRMVKEVISLQAQRRKVIDEVEL